MFIKVVVRLQIASKHGSLSLGIAEFLHKVGVLATAFLVFLEMYRLYPLQGNKT